MFLRPSELTRAARRRWLLAAASVPAAIAMPAAAANERAPGSAIVERADFRTSDGVRLSYLAASPGRPGPTLVFIPGWCMPAEIFRAQLEALGQSYPVVALDPRGQGESEIARDGYTLERRVADIADLLARYDQVVLIGWSLGVLEVLEYAATHGQRKLAGVVLVDNSVGEPPAPKPGDFIARLRADRPRAVSGFVRSMFRSPQPEERLVRLTGQALRLPLDASIALLSYPRPREHWRDIARGLSTPVAYAVTPRLAAQAASLRQHRPATRTEVFERAGHALFVDEAQRFNELVHEFAASAVRPPVLPLLRPLVPR